MMDKDKVKEDFLAKLREAAGIVGVACEQVGIARSTYYRWCRDDEAFREKAEDIVEGQVDFVENRLLKKIREGDTTAMIFYLKTKGKKRGYSEKAVPTVAAPSGAVMADGGVKTPPHKDGGGYGCADSAIAVCGAAVMSESEVKERKANDRKVIERKVKNKKAYIVKLLRKQGKYTEELTYQVDVTARLLVRADMLSEEMLSEGHKTVNVEYSREGNERVTVNPVEKLYLDVLERGQRALRALGMNTESKERKTDGDGFGEFLERMKE